MQQKYLHEHALSNNLINNKLRQEMYLKHLREVQKINNRDRTGVHKEIMQNKSIAEIHRLNKIKAFQFRVRESGRAIEEKNGKIFGKISSMVSDGSIGAGVRKDRGKSLHLTHDSESRDKSVDNNNSENNAESGKKIKAKPSFHYRYRKRQQEEIQHQNAKLMKAILSQRSTILPAINSTRVRASSQLQNSRASHNKSSSPKSHNSPGSPGQPQHRL